MLYCELAWGPFSFFTILAIFKIEPNRPISKPIYILSIILDLHLKLFVLMATFALQLSTSLTELWTVGWLLTLVITLGWLKDIFYYLNHVKQGKVTTMVIKVGWLKDIYYLNHLTQGKVYSSNILELGSLNLVEHIIIEIL